MIFADSEFYILENYRYSLQLYTVRSFVNDIGFPEILYSIRTVNNIFAGKKLQRVIQAHTQTVTTPQKCYLYVFFAKHTDVPEVIPQQVSDLREEFHSSSVHSTFNDLLCMMENFNIREQST